tara:strand:+ start:2551 stop:3438 length:888 start_codon:yes stop_codon:yes gene_type:complete
MNNFYTLSYSETSKGWPSFFSYGPEQMVGINNYFYSFKGGNLYRHNSNSTARGLFYNIQGTSSIKTVFNESPLEAKLFKTIELESSPSAWSVSAIAESPVANFDVTDPQFDAAPDTAIVNQGTASISGSEFEMKEGAWYAYIRNENTADNTNIPGAQYGLRSIKGIGIPVNPSAVGPPPVGVNGAGTNVCTIEFPADNPVSPSISIGDFLYQDSGVIGQITAIDRATNVVTIDNDIAVHTSLTTAVDNQFTYYVQNASAESHGIMGHYLDVTLAVISTGPVELFAVKSDIMKSYP